MIRHRELLGFAILLSLAAAPAGAADLALKRVMLSTGGVAYLEFEAQVSGNATLALDVPLDQVDDVLKSIVVYDDKGGVGSARLPGREPLKQVFTDLPFQQGALESAATLLNALQGAEIKVEGSRPLQGQIVKVVTEAEKRGEQNVIARNRVTVLADGGLQQFILEDADNVVFTDPALQAQVKKALSAIASNRTKDRREIALASIGEGQRTVRVGYVVGAPLWKGTYRITLAQDLAAKEAKLQGWAVLENMSGQDWKDVELTLLAGNPVSFRQAIYEAYYVTRPEVPVEVAGRILPRPDTGIVAPAQAPARGRILSVPPPAAAAPASPAGPLFDMAKTALPPPPPQVAQAVNTAEAEEAMTQVAFRIPVAVSVGNGMSAFVPIADRKVPAERLALVQADTSPEHPLATLRMTNDGKTGLPPGVITLYEEGPEGPAYVGDARLAALPAGESRLLSYAVDEKTKSVRENAITSTLAKAAISQGVLTLTRTERQSITYRIAAPAMEPRKVMIEQPKLGGWQLVDPPEKGVDQTAQAYRLTLDLKPGETRTQTFVFEMPRFETLRIANIGDQQIVALAATRELDPKIKAALADLARLRRDAADKKTAAADLKRQMDTATGDQARVRTNLSSVDRQSTLYRRYMEKLADDETQIEKLQAAIDKANEAAHAADAAIDAFIAKLEL